MSARLSSVEVRLVEVRRSVSGYWQVLLAGKIFSSHRTASEAKVEARSLRESYKP